MSVENLHSVRTKYFADSVEWCLHPQHLETFACATYQLEEGASGPAKRKGSISIFNFTWDEEGSNLQKLFERETDGILDQKWLKNTSKPLLASVTSSGDAVLYAWREGQLEVVSSLRVNPRDEENIALSLDWSAEKQKILVSDSKGSISLLDLTNSTSFTALNRWKAHTFEAWTCCFDKNNPDIVLTGGDDSVCRIYDLRDLSKEKLTIRSHEAGVTSFLTLERHSNIFCTGSYDEHLRFFDMRSPKNPLDRLNLKGGIWRIKSNPRDEELLLCACMYHNFTVCRLSFEESKVSPSIEATFNGKHKSICYGADWSPLKTSKDDRHFFASCSFYDNLLSVNSYAKS
ncbi:diphthine methyltransferase homolog [Phlebotomus argentipes]|uniref:diphthine methyltransferase homolog n=1 Tax=Phlebotomus argentipes TaxID=94469 RepID=UPI0028934430|nr:diphthine methyltransferase homolog [Phlebotomus argentipes]